MMCINIIVFLFVDKLCNNIIPSTGIIRNNKNKTTQVNNCKNRVTHRHNIVFAIQQNKHD